MSIDEDWKIATAPFWAAGLLLLAGLTFIGIGEFTNYVRKDLIPEIRANSQKREEHFHNDLTTYLANRIGSYKGSQNEIELNGIFSEYRLPKTTSDLFEKNIRNLPITELQRLSDRLDIYDRVANTREVNRMYTEAK